MHVCVCERESSLWMSEICTCCVMNAVVNSKKRPEEAFWKVVSSLYVCHFIYINIGESTTTTATTISDGN